MDLDEKLPISNEKNNFEGEDLRRRQYTFGISLEDLELILHPMAEDAKEATGSMGDDTPLAVLSDKYRPLYHFFRQNFSQVTNPPIDSLRENKQYLNFSKILEKSSQLSGAKTIILTARQPLVSKDLEAFLEKKNLPQVTLHAVGSSDPNDKLKVIQDYIGN